MSQNDKPRDGRNFIISALTAIPIILVVRNVWPELIPYGAFEFWRIKTGPLAWFADGWPILAWGLGINIFLGLLRDNRQALNTLRGNGHNGCSMLIFGAINSLRAGVLEEIAFRWLIFLAAMATIRIPNFIFFGFLGFGIPEWFHLNIWGPLANWTTFGLLKEHIFPPQGWAIGAALLGTNAFFRDGHRYQGLLGVVNSWFIGMFMFWIMFHHGLLAAITLHFTYDFLIFAYAALRVARNR